MNNAMMHIREVINWMQTQLIKEIGKEDIAHKEFNILKIKYEKTKQKDFDIYNEMQDQWLIVAKAKYTQKIILEMIGGLRHNCMLEIKKRFYKNEKSDFFDNDEIAEEDMGRFAKLELE